MGWLLLTCLGLATMSSLSAETKPAGLVPQQVSASRVYAKFDAGALAPETRLQHVRVVMAEDLLRRNALHTLLRAQQDSGSAEYHKWLTPEEYGRRFGAPESNLAAVVAWLRESGMTDIDVSPGRELISFSGTAGAIDRATHAKLHSFILGGKPHYANTAEPDLPAELRGFVNGIQGLDDFRVHATKQKAMRITPAYLSGAGASQSLGPGDLALIYDLKPLYAEGVDGHGTTIAIVGAAAPSLADYRAYRNRFGLPANDFQTVVVPGTAAVNEEATTLEAALDLEVAGGVAPGAKIIYVQDEDVIGAVAYVIDHRLADVLSMSYTNCELPGPEDQSYEKLALQGTAEGISWVNATGDAGAAACDVAGSLAAESGLAVNLPASVPEVTAVGGTRFLDTDGTYWSGTNAGGGATASSYVPEAAWNGQMDGQAVTATGGGASRDFFKPAYQSSINDGVTAREIPDVALAAAEKTHPYLVVVGGEVLYVGGTSAATPVFAGIVALVNGYLISHGVLPSTGLGGLNPVLYRLEQTAPGVFHDVTTGNNKVSCVAGSADCAGGYLGYGAAVGFDMTTGIGSVDGYRLASDWSSATFAVSTVALAVRPPAADGSVAMTATVAAVVDPSPGMVDFLWANSAYLSAPVMFARVAAAADGSASAIATDLPAGSNSLTAEFEGTRELLGSVSAATVVTVQQHSVPLASVVLMDVPAEVLAGKYLSLVATVRGTSEAPTGEVNFYLGPLLIGSAPIVNGVAATLSTSLPQPGTSALIARYAGDGMYAPAASAARTLLIFSPPARGVGVASVSLNTAANSIAYGTPLELQALVQGATHIATGTVTFYAGQVALGGSVSLVNGAASGSYSTIPAGSEQITAAYSGDAFNQPAVSAVVNVLVQPSSSGGAPADFTLSVPASFKITAGSTGSVPVQITTLRGFTSEIQLTCTGAVSGYSCTIPATVTPSGTLTVMAMLATASSATLLMLFPVLLLKSRRNVACTGLLLVAGYILTGCGLTVNRGAGGPVAGTYTVTVTGKSGMIVHSAVMNVVVQ